MKNLFFGFLAAMFLIGIIWLSKFYYTKNNTPEIIYETTSLTKSSIFQNTLATGSIRPRKEVKVKSAVSGLLETLYFGTGDYVKKGDLIAKVKIIPNAENLTRAEEAVNRAKINVSNAANDLNRNTGLFEKGVIPKVEYDRFLFQYDLSLQELKEAQSSLQVVKNGAAKNSGTVQNEVRATIEGTILELGALEGDNVIETNTFSEGTTIVSIADLSNVYFSGTVDESEVGKLEEGMPVILSIGALDEISLDGKLTFIAPKGEDVEGTVKFSIQASIDIPEDVELRAGYSANAEIVIAKSEDVWVLNEGNVIFENDSTFVELEISENQYRKQAVKVGLSDGINIEVISGIDSTHKIKVLNSGNSY